MIQKPLMLAMAISLGGITSVAHAFFVMDEEHAPTVDTLPPSSMDGVRVFRAAPASAPSTMGSGSSTQNEWVMLDRKPLRYVNETGDGRATLVKGFGKEQPLSEALKLIAPAGWKGYAARDVQGHTRKINWRGGKPWTELLDDIGLEEGLAFDVDWTTQKIFVKTAPRHLAAERSTVNTGASASVTPAPEAPPLQPVYRFVLKQGAMLSSELERWGEMAGWNVRWALDYDYRVEAEADFGHDMEAAIEKVMTAYQARGGLYGVVAKIFKSNRVISIERRAS